MEARSLPRLNEPAPDFEAVSTYGPIKLSDYRGKWVVLFSHPADFTPVCTTELAEFARRSAEFKKLEVQLIGLSVDSIYSHIAWTRNLEQHFGVKIDYPLIADLDTKVAQLYGMIHPGASTTATVRCVFIIDDEGMVRAMIYYPLTNGRSVDEVMRIVQALQLNKSKAVATPEGWCPGQKVIVPPPVTTADAEERIHDRSLDVTDWYFVQRAA
ncbi:MAG: peroxiredoxin [Deltaproteobacteria bacterium]|nr:peroxiredoxin [Deltaproteobacteria bacterium]